MPAVTTSVVATGAALAGLGMSAAQAVQANKSAKQAAEGATKAATTLEGMKEQNALAGLQVPTLGFDLAQQGINTRKFKQLSELELSRLTGAQLAQYQAELNKQKAIENAIGSGISALGYGAEMVPLYMKQKQPKSTSSGFSAPLYSLGLPQ